MKRVINIQVKREKNLTPKENLKEKNQSVSWLSSMQVSNLKSSPPTILSKLNKCIDVVLKSSNTRLPSS